MSNCSCECNCGGGIAQSDKSSCCTSIFEENEALKKENRELKDYCNAISEIVRDFMPVCPHKYKIVLEKAIEKGRMMVCNIKNENEYLKKEIERLKT